MIKQSKNLNITHKFINHLIINGKKNKGENILSKSIKELQTISTKSSKKVIQQALVTNTPIFKLNTLVQKQRKKKKTKIMPAFISNKKSRISFAIKFIVRTVQKQKRPAFLQQLTREVLFSAQNKSTAVVRKKEIQIQASVNSNFFKNYRWH